MPDDSPAAFSLQVQRISTQLQEGALSQFPDLASRIPGFAANGFDVYVTTGRQQGSTSSASGRIALNAALGRLQPYDDWLAFVIAREMGHVIARHHEEKSVASMATSVMMNLLIPGSSLLKSAASTVGSGIAAGSKRETQAEEADVIAFVLLEAAGFRLRDVSLSLLVAAPALDDGAWSADFRKSSETLMTGIRAGKRIPFSEAATLAPAASTTPKLLSASTGAAPFR